MRGTTSDDKWSVWKDGDQSYTGLRIVHGEPQTVNVHSHCLACAKTDILAKYGGQVDARGWHRQGICGGFLMAMIQGMAEEDE